MREIVDSTQRVTLIMSEIAIASRLQTEGINQIGAAIVQVDLTTQQNAALVEEASAAAQSMEHEAYALAQAVGVFHLFDAAVDMPTGLERARESVHADRLLTLAQLQAPAQ
jgi:methyl-accepting chemotaxis protein